MPKRGSDKQTIIIIVVVALALVGAVVIGLMSLRRAVQQSPSIVANDLSQKAPPAAATPEQAAARSRMLELCSERLKRVGELGRHLEAPVLKIAPSEKWNLDSNEGRQLFENAQTAVAAYVHALISNTEALKTAALKANPDTTYGRKVLEARRLQKEIELLDLQIFNERKRTGL